MLKTRPGFWTGLKGCSISKYVPKWESQGFKTRGIELKPTPKESTQIFLMSKLRLRGSL